MQWVETCSNKCTQNLSYPIWDPSIVFPADHHLMPHTCAVQTTLVRRKSVLEDLYASLPSLDYAVEQCHPRNMHVLTVLTCNVKLGVTWFTKSCRDHQGSPSHKLHRRLFCYGVKWPVRALKHEILRLPSVPRAFTELPPLSGAVPPSTSGDAAASFSARHLEGTSDNADLGGMLRAPKNHRQNSQ